MISYDATNYFDSFIFVIISWHKMWPILETVPWVPRRMCSVAVGWSIL